MQIVTAALLYNDGKYLLCQRPATDKLSLKWEFPGGKLEDGETPEQCLIREVREELCVDIAIVSHFHDTLYQYGTGKILLKFYLACITGGVMEWNVHHDVRWVEAERILAYDLLPADIEVVEKLVDHENVLKI